MSHAQLQKLADALGATISYDDGRFHYVMAEAPIGFCWSEELHELVEESHSLPLARKQIAERMRELGVSKCATVDCEWCASE